MAEKKNMRILIAFFILGFFNKSYSQGSILNEKIYSDSGKNEFKAQSQKEKSDYSLALRILKNQVRENPTNAEYRYYLGYTIDRINTETGEEMTKAKRALAEKASEQFEEVNRLQPDFQGELFLLDPYSKLTSIWGSLAMAYMNQKNTDSAKWAFLEGKSRGGFTEPILAFNRQLLNSCDSNAILVTYGDLITIPVWYLQTVEKCRTDIVIVDANLLNSLWYPRYLKSEKKNLIGLSDDLLDTLGYKTWETNQVTILHPDDSAQKFSWELPPTYMQQYILRGDRFLMDILQQNLFSRPIYFSNNSDSTYNLYLLPYLVNEGLVDRVVPSKINWDTNVVKVHKNIYSYSIDQLRSDEIKKSRDAIALLNGFRWCYYNNIYNLASKEDYTEARALIKQMNEKFPVGKLPFTSSEVEEYFRDFFSQIEKN
jgi:hypothetical protein